MRLLIPLFLVLSLTAQLPVAIYAQEPGETLMPTLVPWHTGDHMGKILFSGDGQFLITFGDDKQVVVTDLKKRAPLYGVPQVLEVLVHPREPVFFTVESGDSLRIHQRSLSDGGIQRTFSIPGVLKESASYTSWSADYRDLLVAFDFKKELIVVPFEKYPQKQVVVFNYDGVVVARHTLAGTGQVNNIYAHDGELYVVTPEHLFVHVSSELKPVRTPEGQNNYYANLIKKGDTIVLLSNKFVDWIDARDYTLLRSTSVAAFFSQGMNEVSRAGIMVARHPFAVDHEGAVWLTDTRLVPASRERFRQPAEYLLARVSTEITYPLPAQNGKPGADPGLSPVMAYHPPSGLFALIERSHDLTVVVYDRDAGELFRVGQKNTPVIRLYFTQTPGRILLQASENTNQAGFLLDLGTGRIDATHILDEALTRRYPGTYHDYQLSDDQEWLFNENEQHFESASYLQYQNEPYLRFPFGDKFSRSTNDTIALNVSGKRFFLSKINGQAWWVAPSGKITTRLPLRTTEKKAIAFNEYFFEKYQFDSTSNLFVINYGSQRMDNGLQYVIDLKAEKLVKQWSFRQGILIGNGGSVYINTSGVYRFDDDALIASFPTAHEPEVFREKNFVMTSGGRFICYQDRDDRLIAFDFENNTANVMGYQQNVEQLIADPHSTRVYTLSSNGTVAIWDPLQGAVATVYLRAPTSFTSAGTVQPTYLMLTPEGYYMGENRYYEMLSVRDREREYPILQVDARFNRPDIILQRLGYADQSTLSSIGTLAEKRVSLAPRILTDDIFIANKADIPCYATSRHITFTTRLSGAAEKDQGIMVYVNGAALWPRPGKTPSETFTFEVDLVDDVNHIRVCLADNEGNESAGDYLIVNAVPAEKKNLYVVGLGVSGYQDEAHNLMYAEKDMRDLLAYMKTIGSYDEVYTLALANEQVSQDVTTSISDFLRGASSQDEVIVFYAGHGLLDESQNFYLSTHAMDFGDPAKYGLPIESMVATLSQAAARKKVFLIDACNSGLIDDLKAPAEFFVSDEEALFITAEHRGAELETEASQTLSAIQFTFMNLVAGEGVNILAAAAGNEAALEGGGLKNGFFTHSLISGLKTGKADLDKDETITINELQLFVSDRVRRLSHGRQRPAFRQANIYMDIPVVHITDSYFSNFIEAVQINHFILVQKLVGNNEVDVNQIDVNGFTALHYACRQGYLKMAQYLIESGADVDVESVPAKFTPAYLAAFNGHVRVLYHLISAGANVGPLATGYFHEGLKGKNNTSILALIENPTEAIAKEAKHLAFARALANNRFAEADSLLTTQRLDINHWLLKENTSALMVVVSMKNVAGIEWLVGRGADLDRASPDEGVTALMLAAYLGDAGVVSELLKHGADKQVRDSNEKNALDYALEAGHSDAAALLR